MGRWREVDVRIRGYALEHRPRRPRALIVGCHGYAQSADAMLEALREVGVRGALLQQRVKTDCNIEILWNKVVSEIKANDDGVYAVDIKDTQTGAQSELSTDGVLIFIGFDPNNQLVPAGTKMNADGYVVTDEKCETITPGIYVIGDLREKIGCL